MMHFQASAEILARVCGLQQRELSDEDNFLQDDGLATADTELKFSWRRVYERVKLMLLGHPDTLPRTASLVQVLGNMTVMLCIVSVFCFNCLLTLIMLKKLIKII